MQQQAMRKFMANVAGLPGGGMKVVVHNQTPAAIENGNGREFGPTKLAEVTISPLSRLSKVR